MNTYENGYRFVNKSKWESLLHQPYDYKNGLFKHLLSNKLVNATNPILQMLIKIYDTAAVFVLHSVDELKNFKNYNWKNR